MYNHNLKYDWLKLDTAAQVFPAAASPKNSSVFRLAVVLTEKIDKEILERAARKTLLSFPFLNLRLRKGFFRRYFEYASNPIVIEKEKETPCQHMDEQELMTHLMRILYYGNRISIEVHHTLGDGLSLVQFLTTLISNYFDIHSILDKKTPKSQYISEDSYLKYAVDSNYKIKPNKNFINQNTFHIKGSPYPHSQTSVIHGHIDINSLKALSKKYGVTINTLIISMLILAIRRQDRKKRKEKMIKIAIPVNLRSFFPSNTSRNFFGVVVVEANHSLEQNLEELSSLVNNQLKNQIKKENLLKKINKNVMLEKKGFNRYIPLIVKEKILKLGFKYLNESNKTMTISNLGIVTLPTELTCKVHHFEVVPYPTIKAPISCGIISYNTEIVISFIKNIQDNALINDFFSIASSIGLDVKRHSNNI